MKKWCQVIPSSALFFSSAITWYQKPSTMSLAPTYFVVNMFMYTQNGLSHFLTVHTEVLSHWAIFTLRWLHKFCTCHTKSSSQNWRSDAPKCTLRKWAPGPPNMSLVPRLPGKIHLCRSSSDVPRNAIETVQNPHVFFAYFWQGAESLAPATRNDIWTIKSGLNTCFAPQQRTLFQHLNFQKCSEAGVFCAFLPWKCASRHKGVHFFISHLARCSAPAALASLLFGLSGDTNRWKKQWFATFLPFRAPASSFLWLFLFSDLRSSLLFSDSSHLCFSSVHSVGSLTSKLPAII